MAHRPIANRSKYIGFCCLWIIAIFIVSCSEREEIVARLGKDRITLTEYRIAYLNVLKQPQVFDSPQLRDNFLQELIERRLLAEEARRQGLDRNEALQMRIQAYKEKAMRHAHFQTKIKPKIKFTENDLRAVYAYSQEQRRLRHLFCRSQAQADSLYDLLQQGMSFADLSKQVFSDTILANNGGDLGWVEWDQMEYDLAMASFSLPVGGISKPIASSYGFHIIRVDDVKKRPMISEYEFQQKKERARSLFEKKIGDKYANEYISNLMAKKKIHVHPKVLKVVGQKLAQVLHRSPMPVDAMRENQLDDVEMRQLELGLWDMRHEVLAELDGTPLTVGAFIAALNYVPYAAARYSLKTALDFVLRDMAITMEAKAMKLDKKPEVIYKTRIFEDYLLQMALRTQLLQTVHLDEAEKKAFYQQHRNSRYKNMPFEKIREIVAQQAMEEKRRTIIDDYIRALKAKVAIQTRPDVIHAFYDTLGTRDN